MLLFALSVSSSLAAQTVRFTEKPSGLVSGVLPVPVVASEPVERIAVFVNGVKLAEAPGRKMAAQLRVGEYLRRLRLRAVGYDADGNEVGADEMVINDPRPPFRVHLEAPPEWPESGEVVLRANLIRPTDTGIAGVDFYVGETKVATDGVPPYEAAVEAAKHPGTAYARVVARYAGLEANDVAFFGDRVGENVEVTVQQIPLSVAEGSAPLRTEDVVLYDNGVVRPVESLIPAGDLPLNVILLIDYSESMLKELPVVKSAARQFARVLLRPQDRLAVVGFNQKTFWLTGYTNDPAAAANVVDRVQPIGETHLYDSVIEMLYEIQKAKGRHALVVLTDGVDQGSRFRLEHLVHYARYAGVPIYPIVKNSSLTKWMRFGIGRLQARRLDRIADDTGATYFIIREEKELDGVYARIADELRRQYQVVFHSEATVADQWRLLRVESRAGHSLRIPRGYFP